MLVDGLSWASGWRSPWSVPTKGALAQARSRLGSEPLRALFEQVAVPLATPATAGAFYRDLRTVASTDDFYALMCADSPANEQFDQPPGSGRGQGVGAFPQLRLVGLAECATHAITRAALRPYTTGELALASTSCGGALDSGMLCLADRNFYSFERFQKARQTGVQLLWQECPRTVWRGRKDEPCPRNLIAGPPIRKMMLLSARAKRPQSRRAERGVSRAARAAEGLIRSRWRSATTCSGRVAGRREDRGGDRRPGRAAGAADAPALEPGAGGRAERASGL